MDVATLAKNIATVLGTLSLLVYATGYVALRARAYALGTEPNLILVDEAYVFAGFRVITTTMLVVLLMAPLLIALRAGAGWSVRVLPNAIQWGVVALLAVATLAALAILTVDGVLLRGSGAPETPLVSAVLGRNPQVRLAMVAALIVLIALTGFWLQARWEAPNAMIQISVLILALSIQGVLLPIYHGALFADRRARVLADIPETVKGLEQPIAIIERAGEQATLLGADERRTLVLVSVPQSDLHGIPIREVTSLADFVDRISLGGTDAASPAGATNTSATETSGASKARGRGILMAQAEQDGAGTGVWSSFVDYLGIVLDAVGSLGDEERASGALWVVELNEEGQPQATRQVGDLSDLSWPIADPEGGYVALRGGDVVRLDASGAAVATLEDQAPWRRLIGVDPDGAVLGLLREGGATRVAVLGADGALRHSEGEPGAAERRAVAVLSSNARAYSGDRVLSVDRSERSGRGLDIFLKSPSGRVTITDCDPDSCVQPSLTPDFRRVVHIRALSF